MKKTFLPVMTALIITISACGQKIDASKVPAAVKTSFAKQFPGAHAKWEKEDGKYEAGFKQDGNSMSAVFDANGKMEETEVEIKITDLPPSVSTYIKEHYKGKPIKESAKIIAADGTVTYEAEVDGKDVIFDASGKYLKEVKD